MQCPTGQKETSSRSFHFVSFQVKKLSVRLQKKIHFYVNSVQCDFYGKFHIIGSIDPFAVVLHRPSSRMIRLTGLTGTEQPLSLSFKTLQQIIHLTLTSITEDLLSDRMQLARSTFLFEVQASVAIFPSHALKVSLRGLAIS